MSRQAFPAKCRHCRQQTLTGLDEDVCAFHATVDPTPLTTLGEALALLAGRHTYELRRHNNGHVLWRRDRWQIKGRTAGTQFVVVAEHRCNTDPLPTVTIPTKAMQPRKGNPDAIPF